MTSYSHVRNSAEGLPFQISRVLPQQPAPFHQQLGPDFLQRLVDLHPSATIQQLCELLQKQRGITLSTTAMCRLIKRHSIMRQRGQHQTALLALAA